MRVNDDYRKCNIEMQMRENSSDDLSVWQYWQRGLANRKEHKDVFVYGDYESLGQINEEVVAYLRTGSKGGKWIVVLNFSGTTVQWDIPPWIKIRCWMAGNYLGGKPNKALRGQAELKPWEGILGRCENQEKQRF